VSRNQRVKNQRLPGAGTQQGDKNVVLIMAIDVSSQDDKRC